MEDVAAYHYNMPWEVFLMAEGFTVFNVTWYAVANVFLAEIFPKIQFGLVSPTILRRMFPTTDDKLTKQLLNRNKSLASHCGC